VATKKQIMATENVYQQQQLTCTNILLLLTCTNCKKAELRCMASMEPSREACKAVMGSPSPGATVCIKIYKFQSQLRTLTK